ncbi:MAG: type II toxin-antitoxin system PemK/MazF family toxin [Kiritimatiellae bacterium]|nr:type II toxin-antitoxin system PemK/MazF family toxin [Kiritimatiellia bacterium]
MVVQRGEIWWAKLPDRAGSEPGCRRPVLVVQSDTFTQSRIKTVICASVTSNLRLAAAPGNVRVSARSSGLPKPSVVNVSQVAALDKTFLQEQVKTLDAQTMRQVDDGLRLVLNL